MLSTPKACAAAVLGAALIASGCGSSSHSSTSSPASHTTSSASPPGASGPAALSGEAQSAATGDIPDNQVFLVFRDHGAGYSIKYPEGWTQQGNSGDVTLKDKNNVVHIVVVPGRTSSVASVAAQLTALKEYAIAHVHRASVGPDRRRDGDQSEVHDRERAEPRHGQACDADCRPLRARARRARRSCGSRHCGRSRQRRRVPDDDPSFTGDEG